MKNIQNNEPLLIRSLKNGSYKAFDRIYQLYFKRLYGYCLQFTKSAEESEEIVHDVFVKLWINREKIKQHETLRPLLFIMAKHSLINAFHARINEPVYEEYVNYKNELAVDNALQQLEYREFEEKFNRAMNTLSATQQKVITLSKIEQMTNQEIAAKLSLSEQTVKNQLSVGLKLLKEQLGKSYLLWLLLFIN